MRKCIRKLVMGIALFGMLGAGVVQAQELPPGYHLVSDGGPSSARMVDENGNTVDYQSITPEQAAMAGATGPGRQLEALGQQAESKQQETPDAGAETTEDGNAESEMNSEENMQGTGETETGTSNETAPAEGQGEQTEEAGGKTEEEADAENPRGIDPTKPMIALTFDDGPYAPVGDRIMDVMKQYNSRCTFFVVGERVPYYTTEMKRMADEGFEIANHTQNHKYLHKLSAAQIQQQVSQCNATVASVTGVTPTLMRLPGGNKNSTVLANVGMPIILWNLDTKDWSHRNTQKTIDSVLGNVKDGDIVLMHELYTSTAAAVETMVPKLIERGYQLVTVSELIQYKGKTVQANTIYHSFQ
ncbi:MAG: polysaccharide deacetylase family protein [bacterium]|nr:polysaccharide deacetylase family protein [bacterium]